MCIATSALSASSTLGLFFAAWGGSSQRHRLPFSGDNLKVLLLRLGIKVLNDI
jgi:hypothetical protein